MQSKIIILNSSDISVSMGNKCIDRAKQFGVNLTKFDAIHGAEAPAIIEELGLRQYKFKMKGGRLGVLGCFLSHYFLWLECIEADEPYMIFEHDSYMLRSLPDGVLDLFTGILKLDHLNPYVGSYTTDINKQSNDQQQVWSLNDVEDFDPKFVLGTGKRYSKGGYGYIIKPDAARGIVNEVLEYGFRPADHQLHTSQEYNVDVQHILPSIVRIHPEYSENDLMKSASLTRNLEANSTQSQ